MSHHLLRLLRLGFPLATQGGEEIVGLYRGLVVAEGVGSGQVVVVAVGVKVHEDRAGTKYDVAVTFPVHARLVTEAKHWVQICTQCGRGGLPPRLLD